MAPETGAVATDREPVQVDREQDDQDDAEPERWHPEAHQREQPDGVIAGPVLVSRGERRQRHRDHDREERRDEHERSGQREAGGDDRGDRGLVVDRRAEVAVDEVVEVGPELAPDRLVQAELVTKRGNGRRRCMQAEQGTDRVAGDKPQEQERDDHDTEHHGNREEDPTHDIAQTGAREKSTRERCSAPGSTEAGCQVTSKGSRGLLVADLRSAA